MNIESVTEEITAELRKLGRDSRQGHRSSSLEDLGVYTPDLRTLVNTYSKRLADQDGETVYRIALALVSRRIVECRQVACELVAAHRQAQDSLTSERLEAVGDGIDNWACVDSFCCTLVGRAWREVRIPDSTIRRWSRSGDLWWRRAAIVSTVPLNTRSRGGKGDTVRTLALCRELVLDIEVMVQKAISWALRELLPWDEKAVLAFLDEHGESVSPLVRREILNKAMTGKKI